MILLRIPRPAARALTALAVGGCAVLVALALAGCGPAPDGTIPASMIPPRTPPPLLGDDLFIAACRDAGGAPRFHRSIWSDAALYEGCDFPPPPCPGARFRPDYYPPPAEAPEGGAP